MQGKDDFVERRILIGLIVSTKFIRQVHKQWHPELLSSATARLVAKWCLDYYGKYGRAPERDVESIFNANLTKLPNDKAEWIEGILGSLSSEYEREQFNDEYLTDQAGEYFKNRHLKIFADRIRDALDREDTIEAERLAVGYNPTEGNLSSYVEPFARDSLEIVEKAFEARKKPLFEFPGKIGELVNYSLVRGGFVALMGPEKRGKSYMLSEFAMRAIMDGCCVAFFSAGDMEENELIVRWGVNLTQRSEQDRYCTELYLPELDCVSNQIDDCCSPSRGAGSGVGIRSKDELSNLIYNDLIAKSIEYPNHICCCVDRCKEFKGTVWLRKRDPVRRLIWKDAYKAFQDFRREYNARFRLSIHPNDTLTVTDVRGLLETWGRDGFIPDVVVIDYADILAPDFDIRHMDVRNQTNKVWQRLRGLSLKLTCLLITATQADAASYDAEILRQRNFSEDKRKYGHVTAMFGLNQNSDEKRKGIMRINELVVRGGDFDVRRTVNILQRLQIGKPLLDSYE